MGFKCYCLFVGDIENGYFGTGPQHSPEKARQILKKLGYDPHIQGKGYNAEIYPRKRNQIVIGAFDNGAFIATEKIMDELETHEDKLLRQAMSCYPGGNLLALGLHSVTGFAAFNYYRNGELIRAFAGDGEVDIIHENGNRMPEEERVYANSFEKDGSLVFPREISGKIEEFPLCAIAEEIIFALGARPLGMPLDEMPEDVFETELFDLTNQTTSIKPSNKQTTAPESQKQAKPFWKFW
ncbi:MAG: hypothetical protein EKK48_07015 [Candidatus Melainabacteria bacterium]|nr:MAG: hypothetical protein EKK48_07015 [Candidatus Melainabacteria bacterium]